MFAKCLLSVGMFILLINNLVMSVLANWLMILIYCVFCALCPPASSSLKLCATAAVGRKSVLLDVCKMNALQCMGKKYMIAEDSTCIWPQRDTTGCTGCHMWENCDGMNM